MKKITIGVLALQGDVVENLAATRKAMEELAQPGDVVTVLNTRDVSELDGLVIPGGESTTIGQMALEGGALEAIKERIRSGMPALGICAGMVLLSKSARDRTVGDTGQALLGLLDVRVERNSFGRQRQSFESQLDIEQFEKPSFRGIFIRAPSILDVAPGVTVLARLDGRIVAVKQGSVLATAFHPELASDTALHRHFIEMVQAAQQPSD